MKLRTPRRAVLGALTLLFFSAVTTSQAAAPAAKGNAAIGKGIYDQKCVSCHKADGSGGVPLGTGKTPNWTSAATWAEPKRKDRDAYLRASITHGNIAKGMVPFVKTGQLKPAEVEHLIAHINVLAKK